MVSEDSSSHSNNNNILHEFVSSNHFEAHNFDSYSSSSLHPSIEVGPHRHLIDLVGKSSNETAHQQLSLSLGGSVPCGERTLNSSMLNPAAYLTAMKQGGWEVGFDHYNSGCDGNVDNGYGHQQPQQPWFGGAIGTSKYLVPAQCLLQEMLSVGGEAIDRSNKRYMERLRGKGPFSLSSKLKAELSSCEFLACDKHGDYVDLFKLIALLEEVEGRYEEYSAHMDDLIRSFEAIAGLGSGKSYTALALLAMSKHFYRLRNAILAQIHTAKQKLMKDMPKISSRLSQLSLFDLESRLNRAILHNSVHAWRPLRGLPETSVTLLRAWLFEHFLHPYPNDSEKLMLASQTGLSKNQVSNWFINARVRLWKPMIEEMYKDEFEESSTESDQFS